MSSECWWWFLKGKTWVFPVISSKLLGSEIRDRRVGASEKGLPRTLPEPGEEAGGELITEDQAH